MQFKLFLTNKGSVFSYTIVTSLRFVSTRDCAAGVRGLKSRDGHFVYFRKGKRDQ